MRQTLLRIPLDANWSLGFSDGLPGFGFGLVLFLWIVLAGFWLYRHRKELSGPALVLPGVFFFFVGYVILNIPTWVQNSQRAIIADETALIQQQSPSPKLAEHYLNRGQAYEAVYEYEFAAADYVSAVEADPSSDAPRLRLAWLCATCPKAEVRDGKLAVQIAKAAKDNARRITAEHWDTLAAAEAELGNFSEARKYCQIAAKSAEASLDREIRLLLPEIRERLAIYHNDQPYREPRFSQEFPQSLPIRGYGFMMFLGFIGAGIIATQLAIRVGLTSDVIWDLGIWALLGGIVGARIFYLVQYHERVFGGKKGFELLAAPFQLQEGGLVLLGGLILGSGVFFGYCLYRGLKPLLMADIGVPAFFLALAFGRLGCLMNGCCYGDRCGLPWAIEFPLGSVPDMALVQRGFIASDSFSSMLLHPSQIYSSINALILAILTATYFRYRTRDGSVLALGMLTYPITRFAIEYLRGDEMGQFGTSFTISQWVSMGLFSAGLLFTFWLSTRPHSLTPVLSKPSAA